MIYIIICLACAIIAGYANSVMDKLAHHFSKSKFSLKKNQQYWNAKLSWRNKYKNGDPEQGERFFLSSTWLVSLTDAWHLYKFIMLTVMPIPGALMVHLIDWGHWSYPFIGYMVLRVAFAGTFHIFYHHIHSLKEDGLQD